MADTQLAEPRIRTDAQLRYKLKPAAVDHAMRRLDATDINDLAAKLGFSRQTFWRLRNGDYDIRLSEAMAVAQRIGWPLNRTFEQVRRG